MALKFVLFALFALFALVCLVQASPVHPVHRVAAKTAPWRMVRSAGKLSVVSRQEDVYYDDDGYYDDEGDVYYDDDDSMYEESELERTPPPTPEPKPEPTLKPVSLPKLNAEYTAKYPETCPCKMAKGLHNGVCYEFYAANTKYCKARKCKPSYMCVGGAKTGITCYRKVNTNTVVPNGDGTCKVEQVKTYAYMPYTA